MTYAQLSEASLDLRAPGFSRVRKGGWLVRILTLFACDYICLSIAWLIAESYISFNDFPWYTSHSSVGMLVTILSQIAVMAIQGLYQAGRKRCDYFNIVKSLAFAHGLLIAILLCAKPVQFDSPSSLLLPWLLSIALVCTGRFVVDATLEYMRDRKLIGSHSVFVICDAKEQEEYANFINKENFYTIVGFDGYKALDRNHRQATLEHLHQLEVSEIFISWNAIKNRMFLCWLFQAAGITIHILPLEIKQIYKDAELSNIGGMPCMTFKCPLITGKDFWIKRVFDFCFASLFVILTSPIYLAIALAIKLDSSGPVFYKQTRVGLHGQKFAVWKFRTMRPDADQMQKELEALNENKDGILFKMKDDPRVTRVGKFLRSYSLDELPQIFNVLRGEMSLIGPRPLATRDVAHFSERHFIRQEVLPGITGWWQVSGRSDILDFDQVMRLDLHYIENWSLLLDVKILFKTVAVVLRKQGAY
jgi:exopolysaccharide biosynthesis polyprenyl glycosylphosphotransferase